MKKILSITFSVILCLLGAGCTRTITPTTGDLTGVVTDARTGKPIPGVQVSLSVAGNTTTTSADGIYHFIDLPAGSFEVVLTKSGYKSATKTVLITAGKVTNLDVQLTPSAGELTLTPTSLDFGAVATKETFNIKNTGDAALSWSISEDIPWLSCNPSSGTTQAGETSSVTVTVDRNGMERGNYSQSIVISSANGGSARLDVSMLVQGINVSLSPEALDFGPVTTSLNLSMTNTGTGSITYQLTPSNNWIKLSRTSGTFTQTETIVVSVDRTTLAEGDYNGSLTLTVGDDQATVPVRMNVPSHAAPTVTLQQVKDITYNTATFQGSLVNIGSSEVFHHGFCWSTSEMPTYEASTKRDLGDSKTAKDMLYTATSLTPNTTYYVRAFAENIEGRVYSNQLKFVTKGTPVPPTVETGTATEVKTTQATIVGNLLHIGNTQTVTAYGHVWSTRSNPTINDSKNNLGATETTGAFTSTLTGLSSGTTYHVRAFATNSVGTAYGEDITFTTPLADATLQTLSVNNITHKSAQCSAQITSTGGHTITERGVCWNTSANPTVSHHLATATTGGNSFTVNLTGLAESTTYHVRAYVRTSTGKVFYGNDLAFSTVAKGVKIDYSGFDSDSDWTR